MPAMLQKDRHCSQERGNVSPSNSGNLVSEFPQDIHAPAVEGSVSNLPDLFCSPDSERAFDITSSKELARSSRQIFPTVGSHKSSLNSGKDKVQLDQPLEPRILTPVSTPIKPAELSLRHSNSSSFESFTQNQHTLSTQSSHPTTPSPAKPFACIQAIATNLFSDNTMGQKASTITRKPVQHHNGLTLDPFSTSPPRSPETSPEKASAERAPSPVLRNRVSSVQVPIPRRRSSLTALHLDSSHFETPISHHDELKYRASTFTSSMRRSSRSPSTITPSGATQRQRGDTLSPPILSTLSLKGSPSSPDAEHTLSPSSPAPAHIHLPMTFPEGLISTPRPPLTKTHFECYTLHRRMPRSSNKVCPVPCMTCGTSEGDNYWKCVWCCLRVCGDCMAVFSGGGRKLDDLLKQLEKKGEDATEEAKEIVEKQVVDNPSGKENMEVKEVGVIVREILSKEAAAETLGELRG